MAAYRRTNLTPWQLDSFFGALKSAAGRIARSVGSLLAFRARERFHKDVVLIVDGNLVPTRDRAVAELFKDYRYSTNHQAGVDADIRLVAVVGRPLPDNRDDRNAWEPSWAKAAVGNTVVIAGSDCRGGGLVVPYRRVFGQSALPALPEGRA